MRTVPLCFKAYQSQEHSAENYEGDSYYTNKKTYSYDINEDGEYDGYVYFDFEDFIPSTYTYTVKVTDQNLLGGKTSYDIYQYKYIGTGFDKTMLLGSHTDQGTNHKIVTNYTYDTDTRLLTNVSTTNYSVGDSTKYMTTSTAYTYDNENYGDVLSEKPNGDTNRMVTYTYHDTYHYPLSKTYKRDSANTMREEYVPTSDAKSVQFVNIYENDALKSKVQYSHDSYGNIINQKQYIDDESYIETQYTYQNGAYVTSETVLNVLDNDNATGNVTTTATYDYWGNRITTTDAEGNTTSYAYSLSGDLLETTNPDGTKKTYEYDTSFNFQEIVEEDELGNRVQTVANGITTEYAYNIANMLTSQTTGNKLSESYTYYLSGNQKSKTSNGTTTTYEYDKMNRLTKENDTKYTFDDFGNRKTMIDGETTTTYTYDLNNRLTESNGVTGDAEVNTKYFYDANGNQLTKAVMASEVYDGASAGHTISGETNEYLAIYDYNCYNQLVGVDTDGVVTSYAYLPDGMRLSKTVGTDTTTFVYDGANIVEEIKTSKTNKYYRGLEIVKNDDNLYYIYNGQGDVAMLTDSAGNIVANYTFDAYGNSDSENAVYNNFGYRGEYQDSESGLIYLRNRYYDPSIGRFINEDPIRDGLNWYVYCGNNPVNRIDPTGENWKDIVYGMAQAIDQNNFGGAVGWVANKLTGGTYNMDSEYDYYLGRVIGDAVSAIYGAGISATGVSEIIGSIVAGGTVTVGSGGTLAVGGVSISTAGIAAGTATVTYGGTVVKMSTSNFGNDYNKMQQVGKTEYKKPISGSGKEKATDVPSWAKGNRPLKSEDGKTFAKRLMDGKYGKGNWSKSSTEYSQIKKWGDRGFK